MASNTRTNNLLGQDLYVGHVLNENKDMEWSAKDSFVGLDLSSFGIDTCTMM